MQRTELLEIPFASLQAEPELFSDWAKRLARYHTRTTIRA